ncbi:hypothetical protein [Pseudolysobacter antarcticus]|uniref:hypothetical protein n=1 Tax=Pseudolysobacter antarcticus TaxID=2511995 RepID=UPI0013EAA33F|nr:hypothetical protein [Pseudolysobacter antarcticus]
MYTDFASAADAAPATPGNAANTVVALAKTAHKICASVWFFEILNIDQLSRILYSAWQKISHDCAVLQVIYGRPQISGHTAVSPENAWGTPYSLRLTPINPELYTCEQTRSSHA